MPDEFEDYVVDEPKRSRRGALTYQPANSDWNLNRLNELKDYYQSTYKRSLPLRVVGQGSIHNKWGYDHRNSADISVDPRTAEGQSLLTEMQVRRIPYLAFDKAIPGVATGPHIHVGYPSHKTAGQYNIGSKVKKTAQQKPADEFDQYVTTDPDFDRYVVADQPAPAPRPSRPLTVNDAIWHFGLTPEEKLPGKALEVLEAAVAEDDRKRAAGQEIGPPNTEYRNEMRRRAGLPLLGTGSSGVGELRRLEAAEQQAERGVGVLRRLEGFEANVAKDTGVGRLRRLDQPELNRIQRIDAAVQAARQQRPAAQGYGPQAALAIEPSYAEELTRAIAADDAAHTRYRELVDALTDEDRQQLATLTQQLRQHGLTARGVDIGAQRIAGGLMYKIAGLLDISAGGNPLNSNDKFNGNPLSDYLRRKASVGELAIGDIEAELPPPLRQQLADFLTTSVGALPELIGATAIAGPVGGFAALGGLEAVGRKRPLSEVALETAKGATLGKVFGVAGGLEAGPGATLAQRMVGTAKAATGVGLGTLAVEKAFGASDADALRSAAANTLFHVGMRAASEIGGQAQAAERRLKEPDAPLAPDVPLPVAAQVATAMEGELKTPDAPTTLATPALDRRGPPRLPNADWLKLTPEEQTAMRAQLTAEMEPPVEPVVNEPTLPFEPPGTHRLRDQLVRPNLRDLMAQRAAKIPETVTEAPSTPATNPAGSEAGSVAAKSASPSLPHDLAGAKPRYSLGQKQFELTFESDLDRAAYITAQKNRSRADQRYVDFVAAQTGLSVPEIRAYGVRVRTAIKDLAYHAQPGKLTVPAQPVPKRGQGGYVDLNEIREGLRAGKARLEDVMDQLRKKFPSRGDDQLRALVNRRNDPLIGIVEGGQAEAQPDIFRNLEHYQAFGEKQRTQPYNRWRYEPAVGKVYWSDSTLQQVAPESKTAVENYLAERGFEVKEHTLLHKWFNDVEPIKAAEASLPIHHSTQQPRAADGTFTPGEPGGPEAERSMLKNAARAYQRDYKALEQHAARREGLNIVNDDVASNYFDKLRRFARTHKPDLISEVDRAENLYAQGKYGDATAITERLLSGTHEYVNKLSGAYAASALVDKGLTPGSTNWRQVIAEVKKRLRETGPHNIGGSIIYDVNKYPKGGMADHAKIAYILEPVVDALKADAARLIAAGKLKAADYVAHVRKAVNDMLAREEFDDWHPINKSAALGVLVDRLRRDGPPSELPVGPPPEKARSLPKTLAKSGREPGTNLTYQPVGNLPTEARVAERLRTEGVEAVESWYRTAEPSAERTAAFIQLLDHYTVESARLADTAPQRAAELRAKSVDLANFEAERATSIGQAEQMYSRLLKYQPAGVAREIAAMKRRGVEVSEPVAAELAGKAVEYQKADRDVKRLERKVAAEEVAAGEAQPPAGNAEPTKPRTYRPRTPKAQPGEPATERTRRQLDEAVLRRASTARAIAQRMRQLEQQRTVAGYWKRSMNITRGLMVSAFSTAMRNLQTQALRFDIERLVDATELTLRKSVGLQSDLTYRNIWRNTMRQFKIITPEIAARRTHLTDTAQTADARAILSHHDLEYTRMFNAWAGGVESAAPGILPDGRVRRSIERTFQTVEKAVELVNIFNRVQEFHIRSAEFLAELDLHLKKEHGQSLEQYVRRHGIDAIPEEIVKKGVDKALEVTFADMPLKDGAGGRLLTSLIEVGNYLPPTLSPAAFPRFLFNNIKFLYQHSPAGMIDLARRSQANKVRVVSRALVGTSMLLLAYQFRKSDHAGEKWYELRFGGHTVDSRPFGPFSTYLFLAESVRRWANGEKAFTVEEISQAMGASAGPAGTATDVAQRLHDYAANGQWEKWQRLAKTEAGEWGRALLTPVRQVKDLIAAFDVSQGITRDTSSEPFLGPIRESIPYAATDLPPAQRPTTATPIHQEHPAIKAITGWRIETPKNFVEKQLDELNFTGSEIRTNTGIPEIDSYEKRLMGQLMDELSTELEKDAEWKTLTKAQRAKYLSDYLTDIREEVRATGKAEHPELYEKLQEERKPRRQREFEQELNSPGLSKALQLGVPLSIPPKRADEDDIAYRARLLQLGRQRRTSLDSAVSANFDQLSRADQRAALRNAAYRS